MQEEKEEDKKHETGSFAVYLKHHTPMEQDEHPTWSKEIARRYLFAAWFELGSERDAYEPQTPEEVVLALNDHKLLLEVGKDFFTRCMNSSDVAQACDDHGKQAARCGDPFSQEEIGGASGYSLFLMQTLCQQKQQEAPTKAMEFSERMQAVTDIWKTMDETARKPFREEETRLRQIGGFGARKLA